MAKIIIESFSESSENLSTFGSVVVLEVYQRRGNISITTFG